MLAARLRDLERESGVVGKTELCWVEGEYGHFLHVQAPEVLWANIYELLGTSHISSDVMSSWISCMLLCQCRD